MGRAIFIGLYYLISVFLPILAIAFSVHKRDHFVIKFSICLSVTLLFSLLSYIFGVDKDSISFASPHLVNLYFLALLLLAVFTVHICFKTDIWGALYVGTFGYCIQHIWGKLVDSNMYTLCKDLPWWVSFVFSAFILLSVCLLLRYFVINHLIPTQGIYAKNYYFQIIVALAVVGINIVYNTYAFHFIDQISDFLESTKETDDLIFQLKTFISTSTVLLAFLATVIELNMYQNKEYSNEVDTLSQMLEEQKHLYEVEKSTIELINIKCHDLRHQLAAMNRQSLDKEELKETIGAIQIYDSSIKTGNEAIDIILTSKSLYCQQNKIQLRCALDGQLLSFIPSHELYSIFGNAIENAIESVSRLEEDKRLISISQTHKGNLLNIHIENYYQGQVKFESGLPQTSKENGYYHGFGVKSIKMLVEKHQGKLTVTTKDDVFSLDLFFVLPE